MSFAFDAELNAADWELLNHFRLLRLAAAFPALQTCQMQISSLTNDLLVICDRAHWQKLQPKLVDLRMASWSIAAAHNVSIFADNHLVYCAMTQLLETLTTIEPTLEATALRLDSSMVTATTARPSETVTPPLATATPSDTIALPAFIDLMPLAQKTGVAVARIAIEITQLGGVAGVDRTGAYITTDKDQRAWVRAYLQRLEADFLVPQAEPLAVAATPKRTRADAAQKNGRTIAPLAPAIAEPQAEPRNFKDFAKAQSYSVTIGRFLDAQGWPEDSPLRAQLFEGIAALPEETLPHKKGSMAERALLKILSKYPANTRASVCKGMIKVARETIGDAATTEPAIAESAEAL